MLRIRLRRVGKKKQPSYRIVVAESTAPRDGKFVEIIGFYNPRTEPETVEIKEARALHWLEVGGQPSESVTRIFKTHGTWARFERLQAGESLEALVAEAEATVSESEEEPSAGDSVESAEMSEVPEAEVTEEEGAAPEEAEVEESQEAAEAEEIPEVAPEASTESESDEEA
jgi:small subunit ribosomal protein S16